MLVFAVGVFAPGVASSQDATIAGAVTDATGGILPGVAVEARDAAGPAQVTVTDGTGQFTFSGLTPGTYTVTFTLCVSNSQFSRENPPHLCGVSPMWTT